MIRAISRSSPSAAPGRCMAARSPISSASATCSSRRRPACLCAEGLLAADLKAEFDRTLPKAGKIDARLVAEVYAALESEADAWFVEEGVASEDRRTSRIAMLRYHGQGGELTVPWGDDAAGTETAFVDAHRALYGFTLEAQIELVTVRVEASGRMPDPVRPVLQPGAEVRATETRLVHFASGQVEVPVLERAALGAGSSFTGPAIVTQLDATTLVPPGWRGETHRSGALLLTRTAV